ncbi:MAG: DUF4465 domain-containing protein [Haliscomenobacteraceae bacterium CHB4]|nr:DUF4465 domain-containing protein [Haliscomenobacteraceae bacterium CHB4]
MQRLNTLVFALFLTQNLIAQTVADFENFNLPFNTFLNDAGSTGKFSAGNISLPNNYNSDWMSWDGWAISNRTDNMTPGYLNESSAIAGGGATGSATYAVSYVIGASAMKLTNRGTVNGLFVTNNTYAYYSMKDGDAFAKKFGGITGNDPDYFLLTVKKYLDGQLSADSVNFYLADYRFANNAQDYILADWTWLNLNSLGSADSLRFSLSSSDAGAFGMNTPAYFCVDHVTTTDLVSSENPPVAAFQIEIFPNPVADFLTVHLPEENEAAFLQIFDLQGKIVFEKAISDVRERLDIRALSAGTYLLRVQQGGKIGIGKFLID